MHEAARGGTIRPVTHQPGPKEAAGVPMGTPTVGWAGSHAGSTAPSAQQGTARQRPRGRNKGAQTSPRGKVADQRRTNRQARPFARLF